MGPALWPESSSPGWANDWITRDGTTARKEFLRFCEQFIVELQLPTASLTLAEPGRLENALLRELSEGVGIGKYPNQGRSVVDMAALAISLATHARANGDTLSAKEVERELNIRTDFGRVAQAFPLDAASFCDRPAFRERLHRSALQGKSLLVLGPPGAGKSWELTRLADELISLGAVVARHYCYLEPGDPLIEQRVTTDVFLGNLIAELADAVPPSPNSGLSKYSVGLTELEAALKHAVEYDSPVVLIIDGLDHIARVLSGSITLRPDETDIIERLATVQIPEGVSVVIGSQPGPHLEPIIRRWNPGLFEEHVPPWSVQDVAAMAVKLGLDAAFEQTGIADEDERSRILAVLSERVDGSPLYARYLIRGLTEGLGTGSIAAPIDWLAATPLIAGDIAKYYDHLYSALGAEAQPIADVLSAIDFSVSTEDLREMLPPILKPYVSKVLGRFAPVLTNATGQGGVRIWHESLRRFLLQKLEESGHKISIVLEPVITWLETRGFYEDGRSYRFLIPAYRRAGRNQEVLDRVLPSFVSDSLAHAQPRETVQRNLSIAADVAGIMLDWAALVRCVELHRSLHSSFDEFEYSWGRYYATYVELYGPALLSERLLFDGRPTQTRSIGLLACLLIDDLGGTAPWSEYLRMQTDDRRESTDALDEGGEIDYSERVSIAEAVGEIRIHGARDVLRNLYNFFRSDESDPKPLYTRHLFAQLARSVGVGLIEKVVMRLSSGRPVGWQIRPEPTANMLLGVADEYRRQKSEDLAARAALAAAAFADTPETLASCLRLGAKLAKERIDELLPASYSIYVDGGGHIPSAASVRRWVATVYLRGGDAIVTQAERARIKGPGWYRCWLLFVVGLGEALAAKSRRARVNAIAAFRDLAGDVRPFAGSPRPCDLYAIRQVISNSIAVGLSLLSTVEEWKEVLSILSLVSEETASSIDREDGGPLPTGVLLDLLAPYVRDPIGGGAVRERIEAELVRRNGIGTYYSNHAEFEMRAVAARSASGDEAGALAGWRKANQYIAAYGFRKDPTVFEIIEGAKVLPSVSTEFALHSLVAVQELVHTVVVHTDGRSTNRAPNSWFRALINASPAIAAAVLAHTIVESEGAPSWPVAEALRDIISGSVGKIDPLLLDGLLATLPFRVEYDNVGRETAEKRLAPLQQIGSSDSSVEQRLRRIGAEILDDERRRSDDGVPVLIATGTKLGVRLPARSKQAQGEESTRSEHTFQGNGDEIVRLETPALFGFPRDPSLVDLMAGLRIAGATAGYSEPAIWERVNLSLGYHVGNIVDAGDADAALRLIHFYARDVSVSPNGMPHPLAGLAKALDNAGYLQIAALAYTLAYVSTRGGGGWLRLGDKSHRDLLLRATELDEGSTLRALACEVAYGLRGAFYLSGVSRHLIERIAEVVSPGAAANAWNDAYQVVKHRLPLAQGTSWFSPLREHLAISWTQEEAFVALILSAANDARQRYRLAALAEFISLIQRRSAAIDRPLAWALSYGAFGSTVLLLLDVLVEVKEYVPSETIIPLLSAYASGGSWLARWLSITLLERAGVPPGSIPEQARQPPAPALAEPFDEGLLDYADVGGDIAKLENHWPELGPQVGRRLFKMFNESQKEKAGKRYQLSVGRGSRNVPPIPVVRWPTELFIAAFDDAMLGFRKHLWLEGKWTPTVEQEVCFALRPATAVHLGQASSRTTRPSWPEPFEVEDGAGELSLELDDPPFVGWTRIGLVEQQFRKEQNRSFSPPVEHLFIFAGAVVLPFGLALPPIFPFCEGNGRDWFDAEYDARISYGPLVGLQRISDIVGQTRVLTPPALFAVPGGKRASFNSSLVWMGGDGAPMVATRTWSVRSPGAISEEALELSGSDMLISPQARKLLDQKCRGRVQEVRIKSSRPITADDWED